MKRIERLLIGRNIKSVEPVWAIKKRLVLVYVPVPTVCSSAVLLAIAG